jgi:hypothetical protein
MAADQNAPVRPIRRVRWVAVAVLVAVVASGCSLVYDTAKLSSDEIGGRDNATAGGQLAHDYLLGRLRAMSTGLDATKTGDAAFEQPFTGGTNLLGVIPGTDLANEYVIVGAHFDHLGTSCRRPDPGDVICNGATDNATGVATVLRIAQLLTERAPAPRRSVVLALWDREEDGLLGSRYYVQHPIVPLAQTAAYVNFDIQGANLLPSLRTTSFAIAAESGGASLTSTVSDAVGSTTLGTRLLSEIFGQGRSDHASFTGVQVPSVFFSDSTGPCYHTSDDEVGIVDFAKLVSQSEIGYRVVAHLAQDPGRPAYTANPAATFGDAETLLALTNAAIVDKARFTASQQATIEQFQASLAAIVAAGPAEFGNDDITTLLTGAASAVSILATGTCEGFLGS